MFENTDHCSKKETIESRMQISKADIQVQKNSAKDTYCSLIFFLTSQRLNRVPSVTSNTLSCMLLVLSSPDLSGDSVSFQFRKVSTV